MMALCSHECRTALLKYCSDVMSCFYSTSLCLEFELLNAVQAEKTEVTQGGGWALSVDLEPKWLQIPDSYIHSDKCKVQANSHYQRCLKTKPTDRFIMNRSAFENP